MQATWRTRASLIKLGLACGMVAPLWWAGIIIYCAQRFPGYNHVTHFISELGAHASPTEDIMRNLGFLFTGGLYLVFALTVMWLFRRDWRVILGALLIAAVGGARIGAGLYACEPGCDPHIISLSQEWHQLFAEAGYWLMMVAAVVTGFAVNRYRALQHVLAAGIGTAAWCALFLALLFIYPQWQGLFQRLASGILSAWMLLLAVSLWRYLYLQATAPPRVPVAPIKLKRRARRAAARRTG